MTSSSDTSTPSSTTGPVPGWMKGTMLSGFIFFVCWGGAISYWRTTRSAPGSGELAVNLLGLPALLVLALFVGQRLVATRKAAPANAASAKSAPITQTPAAPVPTAPLAILGAALRSAHGVSPEELSAVIAAGTARADLDPELVDDKGFPVMSVRSPDAGDVALREEIADWLANKGMSELSLNEEQWRALVLGTAVVEELAMQLATQLLSSEGEPPMLRLVPLLPADWPASQRNAAGLWFEHAAARCGWPIEHITLATLDAADRHAATSTAMLDRLARDAASTDVRVLALLVGCASCIGDETVARWSADGSLFTSAHPQGRIPGEGAAGLLLADLPQVRAVDGLRFAVLEPAQETRRDASADASKRADATSLINAAQQAFGKLEGGAGSVMKVVADTGHRSSRVLELMAFMAGAMPQLDEVEDVLRVGEACGECAELPFVMALALGCHEALEDGIPTLCVSNEDRQKRLVALIVPSIGFHQN